MIRILDEDTINKIAAGEVIERPSSVVKELIENSLDSGAGRIIVELTEGGKSMIRVTDNGSGMSQEDLRIAANRHATSKIRTSDDLDAIRSLGFRGEALSSIEAVSRLQIKTSKVDGMGYVLDSAGNSRLINKSVVPRGTIVTVRDIFYNVPARKKHLKSIETELRRIVDLFIMYALMNHEKYFQLQHNGKVIVNAPSTKEFIGNIVNIYGPDIGKRLLPISKNGISGAISVPGYQNNSRKYQALFINSRPVKSKEISDMVYEAYKTRLNVGKHPAFFLNITVEPDTIDVNVHPQKFEVRISDSSSIKERIVEALSVALQQSVKTDKKISVHEVDSRLEGYKVQKDQQEYIKPKGKRTHNYRVLGQVLKSYALVATDEGLVVVDQHAAEERVRYERYLKEYMDKAVSVQELLEPIIIEVSPSEAITLHKNLKLLSDLGFLIEDFGSNSYILRTVPLVFDRIQGRDALLEMIDELKIKKPSHEKMIEERIIRKACRASVKANEPLEVTQMMDLIDQLFKAEQPGTCPHGRPTMLKFTSADFEKMFNRRL